MPLSIFSAIKVLNFSAILDLARATFEFEGNVVTNIILVSAKVCSVSYAISNDYFPRWTNDINADLMPLYPFLWIKN